MMRAFMAQVPLHRSIPSGRGRLVSASLTLAFCFLLPSLVEAQYVMGPRAAGMGETHRGVGTGNDSIFLNPAGMSLLPRYVIETFWMRHNIRNETLFSISVVDSVSGPVAGGLSYTYDYSGSGGSRRSGSRMDVSSSYQVSEFLLVGSTVRYLQLDTEEGSVHRITVDSGLMLRLGKAINVGVVGQNLWNATDRGGVAPRSFGVGAGVVPLQDLVVGFDYRLDPEREGRPASYSVGAEYFFLGHFGIRAGWIRDDRLGDRRLSGGASYVEQTYALDVSYAQSISGAPGYELGIGLRLFIQ